MHAHPDVAAVSTSQPPAAILTPSPLPFDRSNTDRNVRLTLQRPYDLACSRSCTRVPDLHSCSLETLSSVVAVSCVLVHAVGSGLLRLLPLWP